MIGRVEGSGELDDMGASSVTGSIAPSADGIIEFQTLCSLSGDYEVAITVDGTGCSSLKVAEGQNISRLKVEIVNAESLDRNVRYKILDAPNGYTGTFAGASLPDAWVLKYGADGVYLGRQKGLAIILR